MGVELCTSQAARVVVVVGVSVCVCVCVCMCACRELSNGSQLAGGTRMGHGKLLLYR